MPGFQVNAAVSPDQNHARFWMVHVASDFVVAHPKIRLFWLWGHGVAAVIAICISGETSWSMLGLRDLSVPAFGSGQNLGSWAERVV